MNKRRIKLALMTGIMACLIGCLTGCTSGTVSSSSAASSSGTASSGTASSDASSSGTTSSAASNASAESAKEEGFTMKNDVIQVDDLLTAVDWMGKKTEEIGLHVDKNEFSRTVSGKFFGHAAKGYLSFAQKDDDGNRIISSLSFTLDNTAISDFYDTLKDLYSGPCDYGMEPYVAVNGGALEWYLFDAGPATIQLSQGSEVHFVEISIDINEEPGYVGPLALSKANENARPGKKAMSLEVLSYDNGVLTVSVTNKTGEDSTFSDDFNLFIADEADEDSYYSLNRINYWDEKGTESDIANGETKTAACDLREYGKVKAGAYLIKIGELSACFTLEEAG